MRLKDTLKILCFSFFIFHFSFINAQSFLWGSYGSGQGIVNGVASDGQGNCFLTGWLTTDCTVHFGPYTLMDSTLKHPQLEQFLVKYSHNGNLLWAKQTIDSGIGIGDYIGNVCADRWSNAYITSNFSDTLIIGTYTFVNSIGYGSSYLAKYDPLGNVKWVERSTNINNNSSSGNEYATCDVKGNIYLSGAFSDTVSFGSHTIIDSAIQFNIFLVKYDSIGNVKWAKQSSGDDGNVSFCNANDQFGNSFVTGTFGDTVWFDSFKLIGGNNDDFYIVKYDSNGNVKWAEKNTEIGSGGAIGIALAADLTGNVYALGQFTDSIIFEHDTLITPTLGSFFLVKYDPNGNLLWVKQPTILDNNSWNAWSLSIDNYKHLYLCAGGGYHTCKIVFGGDTLSMYDTASRDEASVIFKLDSNGSVICSSIIPAGGAQQPNVISSDTSGNFVYFGGSAVTPVIFGKDTINPYSIPPPFGGSEFPFAARWEECNPNVIYAGVQNIKPVGQVVLYPNPNNGSFTVVCHPEQSEESQPILNIYNMLGEKVYDATLNQVQGDNTVEMSNQPNGIYLYRVLKQDGSLIGSGKLVIQK